MSATPHWYSLKQYGPGADEIQSFYELFTTTMEGVFDPTSRMKVDDDMVRWLLGVLVCL